MLLSNDAVDRRARRDVITSALISPGGLSAWMVMEACSVVASDDDLLYLTSSTTSRKTGRRSLVINDGREPPSQILFLKTFDDGLWH